ncbi:MAG: hypothetical protein NT023_25075 [Armatimonadetes bacterium]|nr:hypothetical protein [Armatimonadota bacterium]
MKFPYPENDEAIETVKRHFQDRENHLNGLRAVLPPRVIAIGEEYGTEDGLIIKVSRSRSGKDLTLALRCGNIPDGYFDWVLTYKDAEITTDDERTLARLARSTMLAQSDHDADLARHELDITENGGVEHRLEFYVFMHGNVEFAVRCSDILWEKIAQPDRKLPRLKERFPGGLPTEYGRYPNPRN